MKNYECLRCGYVSNLKTNMLRHLKRKRPCNAIYLDVDRCELIKELNNVNAPKNKIENSVTQMSPERHPDVTQTSPIRNPDLFNIQDTSIRQTTDKQFHCKYCNKVFKYRQGRSRHEKSRCSVKNDAINEMSELKNTVIELKNELQTLAKGNTTYNTIHNTTTNSNNVDKSKNTNSFNTVNVTLNTVGNENIEYLKKFIIKNIGDIIQCKTDFFIEYVKQKHFHPKHIENHNVVSFNHRSDSLYAYTKNDTHLERRLKNSISLMLYKNIIDDVSIFLDTQLLKKKLKDKKLVRYNRASKTMDTQLDAISDYERQGGDDNYDEDEKKSNIKLVNTHLKEIENTIYNESKSAYGDISTYYDKHNE